MDGIGPIVSPDAEELERLATHRLASGQCATCGRQLFWLESSGRKVPLSTPGIVQDGICLVCLPYSRSTIGQQPSLPFRNIGPGASFSPSPTDINLDDVIRDIKPPGSNVPDTLTVQDDMTVVSGITLDHSPVPNQSFLKIPSVGSGLQLAPLSRSEIGDLKPPSKPSRTISSDMQQISQNRLKVPPTLEPIISGQSAAEAKAPVQPVRRRSKDLPGELTGLLADYSPHEEKLRAALVTNNTSLRHIEQILPEHSLRNSHGLEDANSISGNTFPSHALSASDPFRDPLLSRQSTTDTLSEKGSLEEQVIGRSASEVSDLIAALDRYIDNGSTVEVSQVLITLQTLRDITSDCGSRGVEAWVDSGGNKALTMLFWTFMERPPIIQDAAALLLQLLTPPQSLEVAVAVLTAAHGEDLFDALLIAVQSLKSDTVLQLTACRIFCTLSEDTSPDANLGALVEVVNLTVCLMSSHIDARGIQEWGTRALLNLCTKSRHCEENKKRLAKAFDSTGDCQSNFCSAGSIFIHQFDTYNADDPTVLLGAKTIAALTSYTSSMELLVKPGSAAEKTASRLVQSIYRMLKELHQGMQMVPLKVALIETLGNFAIVEANGSSQHRLIPTSGSDDIIRFVVETIRLNEKEADVLYESISFLAALVSANLQLDPDLADHSVQLTINAMYEYKSDISFLEGALRALLAMSMNSETAKTSISDPNCLASILRLCLSGLPHQKSAICQEVCCLLLSVLFKQLGNGFPKHYETVLCNVCHYLCTMLEQYPRFESINANACAALRNISQNSFCADAIYTHRGIPLLMNSLRTFKTLTALQVNIYGTLWHVKANGGDSRDSHLLLAPDDVSVIVETLQDHLLDATLVHMACAALWCLLVDSSDLKESLLATDGGIDAISCVLVAHEDKEEILICAIGILTSLTENRHMARRVVQSDCFVSIIESMRSDTVNIRVLQAGLLFLRKICDADAQSSNSMLVLIPAILGSFKTHADERLLVRDACDLLWRIASQSEEGRSRILGLDGDQVLMEVCDKYGSPGIDDQESAGAVALRAFRELNTL